MPIDPRMLAQVQALRAQGGPTGTMPAPGMPAPIPGGRPMGGPPIAPGPGAGVPGAGPPGAVPPSPVAPPQAVAPGAGGGINAGIPAHLTVGASNLVGGMPQAQERFSQGQRQGVQADVLRQDAQGGAQGRMVGRVYVPASITQHGATLMKAYVARQKEKEQKEERRVASEEMSMLRSGFLESLRGGAGSDEDEV